jgi:hypothetical protein
MRDFLVRLLFVGAIAFAVTACGGKKDQPIEAATAPIVSASPDNDGGVLSKQFIEINGELKAVLRVDVHRGLHGTRYTLYTKDGTYEADYPLDFVGPLPSGHCYTNGTGCN